MDEIMEPIKLPPYNSITGRYMTKLGHYDAYKIWRKSAGYKLWRDTQWRIQKGRCFYCKCDLRGRRTNVEHVINQARWGETVGKNMVLSCAPCNREKGSSKATRELKNRVSHFNHVKRHRKQSQKRKWGRF